MTPPHSAPDPTPPALRRALAGRYDLEGPIGRGGMGVVYLARELTLDRTVAIKVLTPDLSGDAACRQRFLREARTAAGLSHPHIVPVFAVDEPGDGEFVMFSMAHVAGETLAERVARRGPLSPAETARLLREIGEALAYAHRRGVVHRDVKPDNILMDAGTGRALLSDFGIAQVAPRGRGRGASTGRVLGTAAFMSPEQASGGSVDQRSDIYALGVVAYYALSGRLPFVAANDAALLALHIAEPAPPLATVAPAVPPRLARVVDRCLAKEPWARFPDAAALVRAVGDAVEPPPPPLAIRAFLVRSAHLAVPGFLHGALTGLVLVPATLAVWTGPAGAMLRGGATAALALAGAIPLWVVLRRVRGLVAAGHGHAELVAALESGRARRLEELGFVYGAGPSPIERGLSWLARVALAVALWGTKAGSPTPVLAAAGVALLAAIAARARTEQRTDPRGARRLRFWRGAPGRWLFRLAALGLRPGSPIATIRER